MLFGAWQFKTDFSVGDILSILTLVHTVVFGSHIAKSKWRA